LEEAVDLLSDRLLMMMMMIMMMMIYIRKLTLETLACSLNKFHSVASDAACRQRYVACVFLLFTISVKNNLDFFY
jgi:hypothetical protein